jgi:hypothetical protein
LQKKYKRRYIYSGWNNYTKFELEYIDKVKKELKENHSIDLDIIKPFGPRHASGYCVEKSQKIENGKDVLF